MTSAALQRRERRTRRHAEAGLCRMAPTSHLRWRPTRRRERALSAFSRAFRQLFNTGRCIDRIGSLRLQRPPLEHCWRSRRTLSKQLSGENFRPGVVVPGVPRLLMHPVESGPACQPTPQPSTPRFCFQGGYEEKCRIGPSGSQRGMTRRHKTRPGWTNCRPTLDFPAWPLRLITWF
jgi:hypothetical protein